MGATPAGRKVTPSPHPRAGPPHLLWSWRLGLHCWNCVESRTRLKSEKVAALPLDLDDLGVKGSLLQPGPFLSKAWGEGGR